VRSAARHKLAQILACTALLAVQAIECCALESDLELAQKYYSAGALSSSVRLLNSILEKSPGNATAHYLKANCLLKLKRNAEAFNEYSLAERISPNSKLAYYCRLGEAQIKYGSAFASKIREKAKITQEAKNGLIEKSEEDQTQEQAEEPTEESVRQTVNTVNTVAPNKKVQRNQNDTLPPGTLELIRKQAASARKRAIEMGQIDALSERQKAENAAISLKEKAERLAARGKGGTEPVALSEAELAAIRSQAAAAGSDLRELGKLKAAIKERESQDKAEEIERQANNLQDQLLDDRHRQDELRLNPIGTNLYIRNYSKPPVAPLHAQAKTLAANEMKTQGKLRTKTENTKVNALSSTKSITKQLTGKGSIESVKGEVLPK
jgi:hypothetical protein